MLQMEHACDLVLATGRYHTVTDWLDVAFGHVGLNWKDFVQQDPKFMRKADPTKLIGDASKAKQKIAWQPQTSFDEMVVAMVNADLREI